VKTLLGIGEKELPAVCAKLVEEEKNEQEELPYPGKRAKLGSTSANWKLFKRENSNLVRAIKLKSDTPNSFLKELGVYGYRDGGVMMQAEFHQEVNRENSKMVLKNYFASFGFNEVLGCSYDILGGISIFSNTKRQFAVLFNIVANNNEILEETFSLIRDLAKSGDWTKVTPLKDGEYL
jgi:hypothetical protein